MSVQLQPTQVTGNHKLMLGNASTVTMLGPITAQQIQREH